MSDAARLNDAQIAGISALSLLEALMLQLVEKNILTVEDVDEAFSAAIDAHDSAHNEYGREANKQVVKILGNLQANGNSVRL